MNTFFKLAVIAGLMSSACSAMAVDGGAIHLKAVVTADSCSVSNETRDQTVPMGSFSSSAFSAKGSESTRTPFHIKLMDCPASTVSVGFTLEDATVGSADTADDTLLALDSTSTATGVGVAMYDAATGGAIIKPGAAAAATYPVTSGAADIALSAALKQDGDTAVTAGDFKAITGFSIVYN
jgi:major type 1 subunit fimbrin (pilin)